MIDSENPQSSRRRARAREADRAGDLGASERALDLCGVALVTDWQKDFGLPENTVKGGVCMSGMYDMTPVRLSWRRTYVNFVDAMAEAIRAQSKIDKMHAPITVT